MDDQAELVAVLREAPGHVDGGALLDVLENLLVAGFVTDNQQAAARFFHRLQRVVISGDARRAGPRELQRLELLAQLNGALFAVVEGVVVEEDFFKAREILERIPALIHDVVCGAKAPAMSRMRLRPETERAHRGASPR